MFRILIALHVFLFSCSTLTKSELSKRTEYLPSMYYLNQGAALKAKEALPNKEKAGFISTVESGWIDFLSGRANPETLRSVSDNLESKKTFRVRQEAKSFFYKESADSYFPAEHEVIVTHLIGGFSYLQRGNLASARVEAKKAAFYLQSNFKDGEVFDSAGLRMWLATLWAACGNWEAARVDLRVIDKMSPDFGWVRELAESNIQPKNLILVLSGAGPDIYWDQSLARFEGGLKFVSRTKAATYWLGNSSITNSAESSSWYSRHIHRNFLLKDLMTDSRYMTESIVPFGAAGTISVLGAGLGVAVGTVGVAAGVGIAWYGLKALGAASGEFGIVPIAAGIGVATAGLGLGHQIFRDSKEVSRQLIDSTISPANAYRYVRFLPNRIYFSGVNGELSTTFLTQKGDSQNYAPLLDVSNPTTKGRVLVYFVPGTQEEKLAASKFGSWKNPENGEEWLVINDLGPARDAAEICKSIETDKGYSKWTLPNWFQFKSAKSAGAFDPKGEGPSGREALSEDLWAAGPENARLSECRTIDLRDSSEGLVKDCEKPRKILCVRTPVS